MISDDDTPLDEVTSVAGYIEWVKSVRSSNEANFNQLSFYRGHADKAFQIQPGVYRESIGRGYRFDESRLFHEMHRRDPDAFATDVTVFERLARMQHHGLPTRLLDVTQNPLVALYFACDQDGALCNKDGVVIHVNEGLREVHYQYTLPETAMAGVERPLDFSKLGQQVHAAICNFLLGEQRYFGGQDEVSQKMNSFLTQLHGRLEQAGQDQGKPCDPNIVSGLLRLISTPIADYCGALMSELKKQTSDSPSAEILRQRGQLDILSFEQRLVEWDRKLVSILRQQMGLHHLGEPPELHDFLARLTQFNFVFPPMNNERIRRQQGAFIVFPPAKADSWKLENYKKISRVLVKAEAKNQILDDLKGLGMTRSFLFPELDDQAKDIRAVFFKSQGSNAL